jgi:CRISPR-associated protein Cas2
VAARTRYLLTYDIREPRRLRRVHRVALDHGYPLQYSVFICDLTTQELVSLRTALEAVTHLGIDSVSIFDLGPADGRGVACVEHLGIRRGMPEPGREEIW